MKRRIFFLIIFLSFSCIASLFSQVVVAATPMPTPTTVRVEYSLPYPGMMPDNPLYFLKTFRDNIIEMLISDPVHKAEFYLLQADKKLNMGVVLSGMGKSEASKEILKQALVARTKAETILTLAAQSGKQVPAFVLEKLVLSLQKHKEVLNDLSLSVNTVNELLSKAQRMLQNLK